MGGPDPSRLRRRDLSSDWRGNTQNAVVVADGLVMATLLEPRSIASDEARSPGLRAPQLLVNTTLVYLGLPAVLLLATWLTPVLAGIAFLAGTTVLGHALGRHDPAWSGAPARPPLAAITAALVVTLSSGVLGLTNHSGDWRKHFAILHDLSERPWPLVYDLGNGTRGISSYYLASYLPAGAVGRVLGWTAANIALTGWLALGWLLVFWWFAVLVGHRFAPLVLLGFAGLDVVGRLVLPALSGWPTLGTYDQTIDGWSGDLQVPSMLRSAYEAWPQVIPAFLLMALAMAGWFRAAGVVRTCALVALVGLAAPFGAAVSLVVLVVGGLVGASGRPSSRLESSACLATIGLSALYFATRLAGPPAGIPNEVSVSSSLAGSRFGAGPADLLIALLLVAVLEGGLLGLLLLSRRSCLDGADRRILRVALLIGGVLLFFRVGLNNDLVMRGTTPLLFVLAVMTARHLARGGLEGPVAVAVAACCLAGLVTPGVELYRNTLGTPLFEPAYSLTDEDQMPGLMELGPRWYPERASLLSQYLVADHAPASVILAGD